MSVLVLDDSDPDQATARDMLINAELRIGGRVGAGTEAALSYLRILRLIGPGDGLTNRGLKMAIKEQRKYWRT